MVWQWEPPFCRAWSCSRPEPWCPRGRGGRRRGNENAGGPFLALRQLPFLVPGLCRRADLCAPPIRSSLFDMVFPFTRPVGRELDEFHLADDFRRVGFRAFDQCLGPHRRITCDHHQFRACADLHFRVLYKEVLRPMTRIQRVPWRISFWFGGDHRDLLHFPFFARPDGCEAPALKSGRGVAPCARARRPGGGVVWRSRHGERD